MDFFHDVPMGHTGNLVFMNDNEIQLNLGNYAEKGQIRQAKVEKVEDPVYNDLVMLFDLSNPQTRDKACEDAINSTFEMFKFRKEGGRAYPIQMQFVMVDPETGFLYFLTTCLAYSMTQQPAQNKKVIFIPDDGPGLFEMTKGTQLLAESRLQSLNSKHDIKTDLQFALKEIMDDNLKHSSKFCAVHKPLFIKKCALDKTRLK